MRLGELLISALATLPQPQPKEQPQWSKPLSSQSLENSDRANRARVPLDKVHIPLGSINPIKVKVSSTIKTNDHAVFLLHGLLASPKSMAPINSVLQDMGYTPVVPAVNTKKTFDGIENGGLRVYNYIKTYLKAHPKIKRISFVGHSLGGMYSREAIMLIHKDPELKHIAVQNLVTFATPHTGANNPFPDPVAKFITDKWPTIRQVWRMDAEQVVEKMRVQGRKSLQRVRNVAFIGAKEDPYVPLSSSIFQADPPRDMTEHVEVVGGVNVGKEDHAGARRFATTAGQRGEKNYVQLVKEPFQTPHSWIIESGNEFGMQVLDIFRAVFKP